MPLERSTGPQSGLPTNGSTSGPRVKWATGASGAVESTSGDCGGEKLGAPPRKKRVETSVEEPCNPESAPRISTSLPPQLGRTRHGIATFEKEVAETAAT